VSDLSSYIIPLKSIISYTTKYDYELGEPFFLHFVSSEGDIQGGAIVASVLVKKLTHSFELSIELKGFVSVMCDRCLDMMDIDIETESSLIVKFGDEYNDVDDKLIIIPEKEGIINIAWYLYECLVLSIPIQHIHPKGKCNKEMEQKLQTYSTDRIEKPNEDRDSRWDVLKDFKQ
jgi:uncharacterized metal-binding protein YceD (DUF177 family)